MKIVALIVFLALAVVTAIFLLSWRKKKKPSTRKPVIKKPIVKQPLINETVEKNKIIGGTYYLVNRVYINEIEFTPRLDIPEEYLDAVDTELEKMKYNETPFVATSLGNLMLRFANGKSMEICTIYNMEKREYDPFVYMDGKQYRVSEEFKKIIQELSKLN